MASEASSAGGAASQPEVLLAKWSDRFFAWLIDFVIVNVAVWSVLAAAAFPFWFYSMGRWWGAGGVQPFEGPAGYGIVSAAFFAYWLFFEYTRGQSIGKMIMRIKTVNLAGRPADAGSIAIESFGKAFLLPVDVVLGWIFTNDKRQRIFNRASNTIVVKLREGVGNNGTPPGVTYKKD
jgi:uncharacterized RDD family membrane protein YckC